jgi:hypothetical protein
MARLAMRRPFRELWDLTPGQIAFLHASHQFLREVGMKNLEGLGKGGQAVVDFSEL